MQSDLPQSSCAAEALQDWNRAFALGNRSAFDRRLAWDGFTRESALQAISRKPFDSRSGLPEWVQWLDRIATESGDILHATESDFDCGASSPLRTDEPFAELLLAPVRAARKHLRNQVRASVVEGISDRVFESLQLQLTREISSVMQLALFAEFQLFLATSKSLQPSVTDVTNRHAVFVRTMLQDGFRSLWHSYPVLARQTASVLQRWVDASVEFFIRLASDHGAIVATLCNEVEPGPVETLEPALSDAHDGRRRVIAITFASGVRVVYKPRDVGIEASFTRLLDWAAESGLKSAPHGLRVLERDGYGWVEYAEHRPIATNEDVRLYYERAGALMCLTYLLRGRDLHMENVVATARSPILVDVEFLLQPVPALAQSQLSQDFASTANSLDGNCLATGLLSIVEVSADGLPFDVGGLRGNGDGVSSLPRRVWKGFGTESLHFVEERQFKKRVTNLPVLGTTPIRPDDHAEAIIAGFVQTFRFMLEHQEELLADEGPLTSFSSHSTRVIPRPTNQYAMLAAVLAKPRYQQDGVKWSCTMDVLHRPLHRCELPPSVWPLVVEERLSIQELDIPRFTVRCSETTVYSNSRPILDGYFARSGVAAVRERVLAMSEANLCNQVRLLRRALSQSTTTRFVTKLAVNTLAVGNLDDKPFVSAAVWIASELLSQRLETPLVPGYRLTSDTTSDFHLYEGGTPGCALLFAALAVVTGDEKWRAAAHDVGASLRKAAESSVSDGGLAGASSGLGSMVYGLTCLGSLLGDASCLDAALQAACAISAESIRREEHIDVLSGTAGTLLALTALYKVRPHPRLLELAIACGEGLRRAEICLGEGSHWPLPDGRCFLGFAHGVAGIAHALQRLYVVTGMPRFLESAKHAHRFLHAQLSPESGNWPAVVPPGEPSADPVAVTTAWCHGAPGIALSQLDALDLLSESSLRTDLEVAVSTTAACAMGQVDHLCCGNLGRAEIMLTVGTRLGRPALVQAARELALGVVARAQRREHFGLTSRGFEYRVFDAGFFQGLSGIGYALLRFTGESRLPSILMVDAVS